MKKFFFSLFCFVFLSANHHNYSLSKINYFYNSYSFRYTVKECLNVEKKKLYFNYIVPIFKQYRLPLELIYIPIIESCFDPLAVSPKGAKGMWQINDITAKHLNMEVSETFDWKLSTIGAAKYFIFLRERFNTWPLILASYNVGPTFVKQQIEKYKTTNIEKLRLPKETLNYVYKFFAMMKLLRENKL